MSHDPEPDSSPQVRSEEPQAGQFSGHLTRAAEDAEAEVPVCDPVVELPVVSVQKCDDADPAVSMHHAAGDQPVSDQEPEVMGQKALVPAAAGEADAKPLQQQDAGTCSSGTGIPESPAAAGAEEILSPGKKDKSFRFFDTPYANKAIDLLEDNQLVRKVITTKPANAKTTAAYVYFDQKLEPGDRLTIELVKTVTTVSYSSFFGVTTCSLKTIAADSKHINYYCNSQTLVTGTARYSCAKGDSYTLPIDDLLQVGDKFQIEVSDGAMFLLYEKKEGKVRSIPWGKDLHPFLIIDGDYNELRIVSRSAFTESPKCGFEQPFVVSNSNPQKLVTLPAITYSVEKLPSPSAQMSKNVMMSTCSTTCRPACQQHCSPTKNCSTAFLKLQAVLLGVAFKFFVPPFVNNNIEISPDRLFASTKADTGPRIVFLTPRLWSGCQIAFLVDSVSDLPSTGSSFQFGLTSCDLDSLLENDCHSKAVCTASRSCGGSSVIYTVSSKLASGPGSVIVFIRQQNGSFSIVCGSASCFNRKIEWTQPSSFSKRCHPFVILNGDAKKLKSISEAELMEKLAKQVAAHRPAVAVKPQLYRFLVPDYPLPGIQISENKKQVRVVGSEGARIVYFNNDTPLGHSLQLRIDEKSDKAKSNSWSLVFGLTRCPPASITTQDWHATTLCNKEAECQGAYIKYGVTDKVEVNSVLNFTPGSNMVTITVGDKKYEFFDHKKSLAGYPLCPFLILIGDAVAVSIIDYKEKITQPVVKALTPDKDEQAEELVTVSGSVEIAPIDAEFLKTPYANTSVQICEGKQAKRLSETGAAIVYLNRGVEVDEILCLKLERFSARNTAVKFEFGVTTCDVQSIRAYKIHSKSLCTNDGRPCGGRSFSFQVVRKGQEKVVISLQRVRDGFKVLCEGEPFAEFKDKKKVVKKLKSAVPFLVLSGDVEVVRIVNDMKSLPGEESAPDPEQVTTPVPPVCDSPLSVEMPSPGVGMDLNSDTETLKAESPDLNLDKSCRSRVLPPLLSGDRSVQQSGDSMISKVRESDPLRNNLTVKESGNDKESDQMTSDLRDQTVSGTKTYTEDQSSENSSGFRTAEEEDEDFFEDATYPAEDLEKEIESLTPVPELLIELAPPAIQVRDFVYDSFECVSDWLPKRKTEVLKPEVRKAKPNGKKPKVCFQFFESLTYANYDMIVTGGTQVKRTTGSGSNIVYFDRCLSIGDTLCLRVDSFSQTEALNLIFGITTCDTRSISKHRNHIKSFCTNDGRPCGGNSMICRLDRKVRGAETISFKKVAEGIHFLSDGFLVMQFRDLKNLFRRSLAYPFIALTGDVTAVSIIDPDAPAPPIVADMHARPLSLNPEARHFAFEDSVPSHPNIAADSVSQEAQETETFDNIPTSDEITASAQHDLISFTEPVVLSSLSAPAHSTPTEPLPPQPKSNNPNEVPAASPAVTAPASVQLPIKEKRFATTFITRKWYSNACICFQNNLITRLRSADSKNYIFSSEMRIGESIEFKVWKMDLASLEGAIYCGFTTTPILTIDFSALPNDPQTLLQNPDPGKWMMSGNLFNSIGMCDGLTLSRTETGITLSLGSEDDDDVEIIPDVDPAAIIYPFFHISGCVQSLRILTPDRVEPLSLKNQVRVYLVFFYLPLLQRKRSVTV